MANLSYLKDKNFLRALDNDANKFFWVRIEVLDKDENVIENIEGRVNTGSTININGSSSMRRTCNINMIAEETNNNLTDINHLLSANKRIRIFEGIKNNIDTVNYEDIIWFPLGVFVIIQPNITHTATGCMIQLSCKDKMCLLNGECAGGLPASITFHEYEQKIGSKTCTEDPTVDDDIIPNNYTVYIYKTQERNNQNKIVTITHYYTWSAEYGWQEGNAETSTDEKTGDAKISVNGKVVGETVSNPQLIYDIIQTLVCNYGGIDINKIFINDVPLEIKQIVRYIGSNTLYYDSSTGTYTTDEDYFEKNNTAERAWRNFGYNEEIGYVYTDFTYPGPLVSSIGDNVCSVLDKIRSTLGNYEYFFDVEGNFVFQEIKNYLNTSYSPLIAYREDENQFSENLRLDNRNKIDKNGNIIEVLDNDVGIIDGTNYKVDFYSNSKSVYTFNEGDGLILSYANSPNYNNLKNDFHIWGENKDGYAIHYHLVIKSQPGKNKDGYYNKYNVVFLKNSETGEYTGGLRLADSTDKNPISYTTTDYRAEIYLQGLSKKKIQQRPDIYEQELLDLFDSIYDFREKKFKTDLIYYPNNLKYFIDYIEPNDKIEDCSVDVLGPKVYSYQYDKINKLYNVDIPDLILIDIKMDASSRASIVKKCRANSQPFANVNHTIYSNIAIGSSGYTAQETSRDLLYQYTNYNESISLQSVPIYYLDVNSRITVQDKQSGIFGDYIINSITLPLNAGNAMSITATRALERI